MGTDDTDQGDPQRRTLRAMGITLLGVILSVAFTVGFGVTGPWWLRLAAGAGTAVVLVAAIKLGTAQGSKGAVTRAADWITGEDDRQGG
jgi:peptidoglycan/LPS O-acetylase OafA/YrhL